MAIKASDSMARALRLRPLRMWMRAMVWCAVLVGGAMVLFGWTWSFETQVEGLHNHLLNYLAFAIRTLPLHGLIACIVLLKLALLLRMRLVLLPLLAIGAFLAWPVWLDVRPKSGAPIVGETLTIYSSNLLFGLADPNLLIADIWRHDPDIVLLQEYTALATGEIRERLLVEYPHVIEASMENAYGEAIFSRLPFSEPARLLPTIDPADPKTRVVVELGGREVVVQNIHLASPLHPRVIERQSQQTRRLIEWARSEERPVVLAGDFNCTPASAHATWIREAGFTDAHRVAGEGIGATWAMLGLKRLITHVRIDHIYTSKELISHDLRYGGQVGADHRPVIAVIGFRTDVGSGS